LRSAVLKESPMASVYFLATLFAVLGAVFYFTRNAPRGVRKLAFSVIGPTLFILAMITGAILANQFGIGFHVHKTEIGRDLMTPLTAH
jgi:uncharacterized membrane protein